MKNLKKLFVACSFGANVLLAILMFNNYSAQGQSAPVLNENVFTTLPTNLKLPSSPQRYHITTDYFNHSLQGAFYDKIRVTGDFTTNLPGSTERWNNVFVAKSQQEKGEFGLGEPQKFIENFTYSPSADILKPEFFKDFPFEAIQVKNLVWDLVGIEAFAWGHLDSLRLNKTYEAKQMNGNVELAGLGSFKNSNIQLTWKGVSMINNKVCGLIDFRAMDNPLEVNMKMGEKDFGLKGTSHYWGTIYISLTEKTILFTELLENVMMEMKWSDQPAPQYVYTTRFMKIEKIQ